MSWDFDEDDYYKWYFFFFPITPIKFSANWDSNEIALLIKRALRASFREKLETKRCILLWFIYNEISRNKKAMERKNKIFLCKFLTIEE